MTTVQPSQNSSQRAQPATLASRLAPTSARSGHPQELHAELGSRQ
jgi:hypothetical protein